VDSLGAVELLKGIGKEFPVDVSLFELTGGKAISAISALVPCSSEIQITVYCSR
jgi:hypothetical protein